MRRFIVFFLIIAIILSLDLKQTYAYDKENVFDINAEIINAAVSVEELKATPGCTYWINPSALSISSSAATLTFVIETSASNCEWTIGSSVPWITITNPETLSGTGTSTITISISANTSSSQRTGNITITDYLPSLLAVTQEGVNTCATTLTPLSMTHDYNSHTGGTVNVTVPNPACTWSIAPSEPWITITSPVGGFSTGSGVATYSITENTTAAQRTGKIYIGGSEFDITQQAKPLCPISITATPPTSYPRSGGQGIITVTAASSCSWSASSSAPAWLSLSPAAGTGNGLIVYTVGSNSSSNARSAYIVVGGSSIAITQEGYVAPVCAYTITPPQLPLGYQASSNNVAIVNSNPNNPSACIWTAISNVSWLTITSPVNGQGAGTNVIKFSVSQNTSGSQRTGSIILLGAAVSADITQSSLSIDTSGIGQALDNASLNWNTGGSLPFFVDSSEYIYGSSSARTGLIADSQTSWIQTTVTGPGTLSFYWKVSSERGFDLMRFAIDGVKYSEISGEIDWQRKTFDISEGAHILRWTYSKDSTSSAGLDAGWLDKVEFNASVPAPESEASLKPLYRFYNVNSGAHFFTASETEREHVIKSYPHFRYEGIAYKVFLTRQPDTSGVYRFFNNQTSVHFYTINEGEKDEVIKNYPHFQFEGIAFYGSRTKGMTDKPVYRFYNIQSGTHFYTIDESERDYIQRSLPQFRFEGTAYFSSP